MKDENQELFNQLLKSENEKEVIEVLKDFGFWDIKNNKDWKYFGDNEANYSTINNQNTDQYGALVEKLVNSIDANLILEARLNGLDPESEKAPASIQDAVEKFFNIKEGNLRSLSNNDADNLAQRTMLVATGAKAKRNKKDQFPSFLIIDKGEGQSPNKMEDTLLSLNKGNKQKIKFVQGLHNQGGTAVIRHCGDYGFQLIASKKHPKLIEKGDSDEWGFTLTRRVSDDEREGQYRSSVVMYLAPGGEIPRLRSKKIKVLPGDDFNPYKKDLEQGTIVKLYEYKVPQKSKITLDLRRRLNSVLLSSPLPIGIVDTRGYGGGRPTDRILGLWNRKEGQFIDGIKYAEINVPNVGDLKIKYGVFETRDPKSSKNKEEKKKKKQLKAEFKSGAYFTLNGQTHGQIPGSFIRRKCKLDELEDNLLIDIKIESLSTRVRENLTKTDRNNSSEGKERDAIESALLPLIRDNAWLKQLNAEIKRDRLSKAVESDSNFQEVLNNLIKNSPNYENLLRLLTGDKFLFLKTLPSDKGLENKPKLRRFPTFFEFENKKNLYEKTVPLNVEPEIQLITDAQDDYFDRPENESPGIITYSDNSLIDITHSYLVNGRFYLKLKLPKTLKEGDKFELDINITDDNQGSLGKNGFENKLLINITKEKTKSSGSKNDGKKRKRGNGKKATPSADFPKILWFQLEDAMEKDYEWTNSTSLVYNEVDKSWLGNLDNKHLLHSQRLDPDLGKLYEFWFGTGLLILGLGLIQDGQSQDEINRALQGAAATIIPTIELYTSKDSKSFL